MISQQIEKFSTTTNEEKSLKTKHRKQKETVDAPQFKIKSIKNKNSKMETILIYIKTLPTNQKLRKFQKLESNGCEIEEIKSRFQPKNFNKRNANIQSQI